MPRYIDAEKKPEGPLWNELTDKEKLNVLNYLLSSSSSDVIRNIFEDIEEHSIVDTQICMFKEDFNKLKRKYGVKY